MIGLPPAFDRCVCIDQCLHLIKHVCINNRLMLTGVNRSAMHHLPYVEWPGQQRVQMPA